MNPESKTHRRGIDASANCREPGGTHASVIRRMIDEAPPFRPQASPRELVAEFAHGKHRMAVFLELHARGPTVLPAIREGLQHTNWQIRRWCAIIADNFADPETLQAVVPLLRDPKAEVRVWAVHSLACESCKDGRFPIDVVPMLMERIKRDTSIKVRRQAVAMLAHHRAPDARLLPVFKRIMSEEIDQKLRLHAMKGLERYTAAGL